MNQDELFNLLDLGGKEEDPQAIDVPASSGPGRPTGPVTEECVVMDDWDREKGADLYQTHRNGQPEWWSEFHTISYATDPQLTDNPANKRRSEYIEKLMESQQYQELRQSTVLNELTSEMAAHQFMQGYVKLAEKDRQRQNKPKKQKLPGKKDDSGELQAEMDLIMCVNDALNEAQKEADEMMEACKGLGMGVEIGRMDTQSVAQMFRRVRQSPTLKRICDLAGAYRRSAQGRQRQKVSHGYDEVVGVHMDGDIGRLLPVELGSLGDELLELDTMRRLVERQTMCREYKGSDKMNKGPIVVCVDESGSMRGEPVCQAKAFGLAMAWVARKQNRWCALVGYAGGTAGTRLALPPGKWDENKLMDWLGHFYGGGTVMDVPLKELPTTYWDELKCPKGKTDLIIITDGIVSVPQEMEVNFKNWKLREKVRCISLILAGRAGDLEKVSDEVHLISQFDVTSEAIGRCLSI